MYIIQLMQDRLKRISHKFEQDLKKSCSYPDIRIKPIRGMFTDKQIKAAIDKTPYDVTRCYMKWTDQEDQQLRMAFLMGKYPQQLSISHKRTLGAIHARLIKLNLMDRAGNFLR